VAESPVAFRLRGRKSDVTDLTSLPRATEQRTMTSQQHSCAERYTGSLPIVSPKAIRPLWIGATLAANRERGIVSEENSEQGMFIAFIKHLVRSFSLAVVFWGRHNGVGHRLFVAGDPFHFNNGVERACNYTITK